MTDRERWTVYPLLFLALGLTLRDKMFPPAPGAIHARQLTILGEDDQPNILLRGSDKKGGKPAIEVLNGQGRILLVAGPSGAIVETTGRLVAREVRVIGAEGQTRLALGVAGDPQSSGRIEWYNGQQQLQLAAGGSDGANGIVSSYRDGKPQFSFGSSELGTLLIARDPEGRPYLVFTCDEKGIGRGLLFDPDGNGQLLVGQPVSIKLNEVQPPEAPATDAPPSQPGKAPPTPAEDGQSDAELSPPAAEAAPETTPAEPAAESPAEAEPPATDSSESPADGR